VQHISCVSVIGAGNVGTHLTLALHHAGIHILQVCSSNKDQATRLCEQVGATYISGQDQLNGKADAYFLVIPDKGLRTLDLPPALKSRIIVHTSGSTPVDVLADFSQAYGVFYPLQTFSMHREISFQKIPVCIEANTPDCERQLLELAARLSNTVQVVHSEQRRILHLAAVFACNFSNYMYSIAEDLLKSNDLSFDLLEELITETAQKAAVISPMKAQTGPAMRKDKETIKAHLKLLETMPEYLAVYRVLTQQIQGTGNREQGAGKMNSEQ
jgi:predicted short-subunit dehydrogenase-like oxidoreductase (DUF2520 family)